MSAKENVGIAQTTSGESRPTYGHRDIPLDASRERLYSAFTTDDAQRLVWGHEPKTESWEASTSYYDDGDEERTVAAGSITSCQRCHELWGDYGCTTVRAVKAWQHNVFAYRAAQDRITDLERRADGLTEALTPRFGVSRLHDVRNDRVEMRMTIDSYSLIQGGFPVVVATLQRMGNEFKAWFRKVGDKQRIAADHLYALTLDSEYYTHLTQDFKMTDGFHKEPFMAWTAPRAPWDDPTWKRPSHTPVSPTVGGKDSASDAPVNVTHGATA